MTGARAYADYGYAVKNVYVQCTRAAAMRSQAASGDRVGYDEALAELGKLTDERTVKWESVLLLGNPDTIAAARTWHRRVWQVERFARGERTRHGSMGRADGGRHGRQGALLRGGQT